MARGNHKGGQRNLLSAIQGMTVRTTQAPNFVGFDGDQTPIRLSNAMAINRDLYRDQFAQPGDMPERTPRLMPERLLNAEPKASLADILARGDLFSADEGVGMVPYRVSRISGKSFVGVDSAGKESKFVPDKTDDGRVWRFTDRATRSKTVVFGLSRKT